MFFLLQISSKRFGDFEPNANPSDLSLQSKLFPVNREMTAYEVRPFKIILRVRRRRRASSEYQKYPVETQKVPSFVRGYVDSICTTYFNVLLTKHAHYFDPLLEALPLFGHKDFFVLDSFRGLQFKNNVRFTLTFN